MKYLNIKMLRDMKSGWSQFLTVFLMALISVMIFAGMASVWNGMKIVSDKYGKDCNLADKWVYALGMDKGDGEKIEELEGVEQVTLSSSHKFTYGKTDSQILVTSPDNLKALKPITIEGDEIDLSQNGIWIDRDFAKAHNIKVNDYITLETSIFIDNMGNKLDISKSLEVIGIVMDAEFINYTGSPNETIPDYNKNGYGFVSNSQMAELIGQNYITTARIKVGDGFDKEEVKEILGSKYIRTVDREKFSQFYNIVDEADQMQRMSVLFSAVFILLAMLTMYTSMVRLVNKQTIQIGTFKAIGIKSRYITLHYCLYGLIIPVIAGVVGLFAGKAIIGNVMLTLRKTTSTLPEWQLIHSWTSFLVIGLLVGTCMGATLWASRRVIKGMPAETMRGNVGSKDRNKKGKEDNQTKESMEGLPYFWRWVLRDILRNKARFIMGIVGVAGGLLLIISGIGIKQSIDFSNDYVFKKQFKYDYKAELAWPGLKPEITGEHQWTMETEIITNIQSKEETMVMMVFDEGQMFGLYDDNDHEISLPKEGVLISRKIADQKSLAPGDKIKVQVPGEDREVEMVIKATTKVLSPQGLFLSKEYYETLGLDFVPTSAMITGEPGNLKEDGKVANLISKEGQKESTDRLTESVGTIVKLLIGASILLSVVILYNLGILSFVERNREYATMKVLGFKFKEIRGIAIRECVISALIGWIIGVPLGIKFLGLYISIVSFENFEWITHVTLFNIVVSSIVIVGASLIVNLIISGKVKRVNMVEALKTVE